MKKIYVFLTALLSICMLNAQTFKFYYKDAEIKDNVEIVPQAGGSSTDFIDIENITSQDITFKVQIVKEKMAENADVMMCFGEDCLAVTTSPAKTLKANERMSNHFDLVYNYVDDVQSEVRVNMLTEDEQLIQTFLVKYVRSTAAINSVQNDKNVLLSAVAQPNPATNAVSVAYSVPAKYQTAQLIVRNSLGSVIKAQNVKVGVNGKVTLNVSELANGVYFYSIVSEGATLITKKLIVKH
ncbi:MAG: T9SS type A sorting domain-containing protein [Bacteroidales bacterium]|nr:T9SS type A sorting domain-containing protein [Bacteroidales bacterium]